MHHVLYHNLLTNISVLHCVYQITYISTAVLPFSIHCYHHQGAQCIPVQL